MSEQSPVQSLKSQVQLRNATETDVPFIFNSWLKSYRSSALAGKISNPVYFQFQHQAIERLLKRSQVKMLCSAQDPNDLKGYVVFEQIDGVLVLHYAYIKHSFRRLGLLKYATQELSLGASGFYTHDTPTAAKIIKEKSLKLVYNPYLAFEIV